MMHTRNITDHRIGKRTHTTLSTEIMTYTQRTLRCGRISAILARQPGPTRPFGYHDFGTVTLRWLYRRSRSLIPPTGPHDSGSVPLRWFFCSIIFSLLFIFPHESGREPSN